MTPEPLSPRPIASRPRNIAVAGPDLAIAWADGHESYLPIESLRKSCPCATCRAESENEAREGPLRVLRGKSGGASRIARISPVGTYAIQIVWADGHDSGLYTYEMLRLACRCEACSGEREGLHP